MQDQVIIVAIVFGSIFGIIFLGIVSNIIKTWIKRGSSGKLSENKEFITALREFKEKTDRRLSNLEAIIAEQDQSYTRQPDSSRQTRAPGKPLDIELDNLSEDDNVPDRGNLRNMLNQ